MADLILKKDEGSWSFGRPKEGLIVWSTVLFPVVSGLKWEGPWCMSNGSTFYEMSLGPYSEAQNYNTGIRCPRPGCEQKLENNGFHLPRIHHSTLKSHQAFKWVEGVSLSSISCTIQDPLLVGERERDLREENDV